MHMVSSRLVISVLAEYDVLVSSGETHGGHNWFLPSKSDRRKHGLFGYDTDKFGA